MKFRIPPFLICISITLLILQSVVASGQPKPKIGLVLSGGGAKGIAHIRILQVLDSLGIVPDYIAGTSMGSVVGGLYATGYTGHQIDSITRSIDWGHMFSNNVSFDEINIEEKDEFGRYIYELPMDGLKPKLPMGLVEGQHIEEMLSRLFFPVNSINDFRKLPTPFFCVASDIVKGEPVILQSGSLATAVRASMSIPTVFAPVRIGDRLLVDGGLFNNMPVSYCRQMGADFIIAVDVGGGLMKESELTSAAQFLLQSTLLAGNLSYEKEKSQSDILVDVFKHLQYGTMDFEQGPSMMKSGDLAVHEIMPQLVELSRRMSKFPTRQIQRPEEQSSSYRLLRINLEGVSTPNQKLVKNKFTWREGESASASELSANVHRLMGTRLFSKIGYSIIGDSVLSSLTLKGTERPTGAAKFAMHFDSERGAGVILNFTKRNLMLPASRMVATLDLAENPRARLNYFYYTGKRSRWWHFTELYGERVLMNSFINGTPLANVINSHISLATLLNYSISTHSFAGIGVVGQWNKILPKIDPRDEVNPDSVEIIKYNFRTVGLKLHYQYNSFDKVYFPTKGKFAKLEARFNLKNPFKATTLETGTTAPGEKQYDGRAQNYLQVIGKIQKNMAVTSRATLQLIGQAALMAELTNNYAYSAYNVAAGDFVSVGGQLQRPRANNFTFTGLRESEFAVPQILAMGAQLQTAIAKNMYVTPSLNILAAGYDWKTFWKTLPDFHFSNKTNEKAFWQIGYGATAGYMSPIGPIQVTVASDAQVNKWRILFGLGFNL